MNWCLHRDGSFDLIFTSGSIRNIYPGVDHQDIRPLQVQVEATAISYELECGTLRLDFVQSGPQLRIKCSLSGAATAPYWLHPVHSGRLQGFSRFFRQGIGFSGPSGWIDFGAQSNAWVVESYLISALFDETEQLCLIAAEQHREFHFKMQIHNRLFRHNFRNREVDADLLFFEAGFRTECLAVKDKLVLPDLVFTEGQGLFQSLRAAVGRIAAVNQVPEIRPPGYHYCSCYHYGPHFTLGLLEHMLEGLGRTDPQIRLQTVQIDDWYMRSHGDWLSPRESHFPGGLAPAFDKIKATGRTPGIWVAPFMVGCESELARLHPDWLLHKADGSLQKHWKNFDGGLGDYEQYVLDTSHPDALAWIRKVFQTMYRMGARFFKTDFLEWGYVDSTKFLRYLPGKTSAQYFDDVLRTIRDAIGDESYWLGCITYFAPCIGYMNGMRMTSDIGTSWNREGVAGNDGVGGGVGNVIEESFATLYMNNVFWQNDPDVVYVRDWHLEFNEMEFRSLAAFTGMLGHSVNTSDEIGDLPPERLAWWRWLRPQQEPWTAELPYFARNFPLRVAVRAYPDCNGYALLALNDRHMPVSAMLCLADLIGQKSAAVFRWSPHEAKYLGTLESFYMELDAHESELLYISLDGNGPPADLNLGGSRGI